MWTPLVAGLLVGALVGSALFAQGPFGATLGDALAARGYHTTAWRRQPDGVVVTGRFNPGATDFDSRYGAGSSTRKGSAQGENICLDFIPDLYPELGLTAGYRLTAQDVVDLRMVAGAYPALQNLYRTKFKVEPCSGVTPQPKPEPVPCPEGQACRPEPPACPSPKVCPPEAPACPTCPTLTCPPIPAAVALARERLAAAAALSRSRPVAIGPALRAYIGKLLAFKACEESTGSTKVVLR